jgi:hypothetical protein
MTSHFTKMAPVATIGRLIPGQRASAVTEQETGCGRSEHVFLKAAHWLWPFSRAADGACVPQGRTLAVAGLQSS